MALHSSTPAQTLRLRAVSQRSLSSGIGAVPTALGSLCHAHRTLGHSLSLSPTCPPLTQLRAVPLCPVTVPRKQTFALPSTPCEELEAAMRPPLNSIALC